MLTLTPDAVEQVKRVIEANPGSVLRVGVKGGGCSGFSYSMVLVSPDTVNPDWNVFEQDGIKVYVDQMSAMYLEGTVVGFKSDEFGQAGFTFANSAVKSTCGCGQSFSI
jgi:iron-sulfur cluster assembly accessory protein